MTGGWLMAVDGTGLFVRCARAGARTGMTAPDGTPTGALTLFASSLAGLVREAQPQYLVIAWDGGNGTAWRREIVPDYKGNRLTREYPPRDTREFDAVREFCNAAQVTQWCLDDFEGDDLLAAACRLSWRDLPDVSVLLCSDDRDVLQLTEPGRVYVRTLGKDGAHVDVQAVVTEWGVYPENLPSLRALAGDASDGIPGLPGVGPVRALAMLRRANFNWPLPEEILADPGQQKQARAWRDVMTLHGAPKVPEDHDVTGMLDIRKTTWTRGNIMPVLERYGMRKMAERWSQGTFW
jgi:DNA polymerase-1